MVVLPWGCVFVDSLLRDLLDEFARPEDQGIALLGSHARGDAGPYSDIDLVRFASQSPQTSRERYTLVYRQDRLVALSVTTVDAKEAELADPAAVPWCVPGLRQMRILRDPQGELARLKARAAAFDWASLKPAADEFVSERLMGLSEEVHKLLNALRRRDESCAANATLGLVLGLTGAVAVHMRLLIPTENDTIRALTHAMGPATDWSHWYRNAMALEPGPADRPPALWRAEAGLRLYLSTAERLLVLPADEDVVRQAVRLIRLGAFTEPAVH